LTGGAKKLTLRIVSNAARYIEDTRTDGFEREEPLVDDDDRPYSVKRRCPDCQGNYAGHRNGSPLHCDASECEAGFIWEELYLNEVCDGVDEEDVEIRIKSLPAELQGPVRAEWKGRAA
jgi:hypothetical protein